MRILVPVDGAEPAQRAVEWVARTMEGGRPVDVVLINVRPGPVYHGALEPLESETLGRHEREHQRRMLDRALAHARAVGLPSVRAEAAQGPIGDEIVRCAKELGIDQIVMGTHGRGAAGAYFLGSVAHRVAHLAPMPVTLVK